jgi:glycosyltransferase involved in cell wall biosynthesis
MAKAWRDVGHRVDIVGPPEISVEEGAKVRGSDALRARVYRRIARAVPEAVFELLEILYNMTALRGLKNRLAHDRYNFFYERYAIFNWSGATVCRRTGTPFVLEVNYTCITPLVRKRSRFLAPLARRVEDRLFHEAEAIVVVSTYLKEHLEHLYRVPGEKILVLPNAADPDRFSPDRNSGELRRMLGLGEEVVIGFVGGFYPWHGLDLLCDALKGIRGLWPRLAVVLVGDGPEKSFIRELFEREGMASRIRYVDPVPHRDIPRFLGAFDLAVMPDSNEYGSPMKIFEYMSMGIPVVAPRLGPIEDGIDDGVEGFLFAPRDKDSFATALGRLIEDRNLRTEMGRAARLRVLARHTWAKNAEAVLQFLEKTARGKAGRGQARERETR